MILMKNHGFNREGSPGGIHIWCPSHLSWLLFNGRGRGLFCQRLDWAAPQRNLTPAVYISNLWKLSHNTRTWYQQTERVCEWMLCPSWNETTRGSVAIFITLYQTMMKTAYCPFKAATPPQLSENAFHHGLRFQITGSWSQQKHNICNPSSAKPDMLRPLAVPRDLSLKITISMKTKGSLGRVQRPLRTYLT